MPRSHHDAGLFKSEQSSYQACAYEYRYSARAGEEVFPSDCTQQHFTYKDSYNQRRCLPRRSLTEVASCQMSTAISAKTTVTDNS